ncbi:MAG: class I SAM-dependent methyltransferase [Flavobacteriales bacterium]|jgi:SAM-dependent methyltransferase
MTEAYKGKIYDVMGRAMERYHRTGEDAFLQLWIDGEPEPLMPVSSFFRRPSEMNDLELEALHLSQGRVLDVGAGAGSHSLALQARGLEVIAVEVSPSAAQVAEVRGVKRVVCSAITDFHEKGFDTILLLMNGFGIAGNEAGLEKLLLHLKSLLAQGGCILADSTNLGDWEMRAAEDLSQGYFGEVVFRVFNGVETDEFKWIYPDEFLLEALCDEMGLAFEVVQYGNRGAFLCKISHAG